MIYYFTEKKDGSFNQSDEAIDTYWLHLQNPTPEEIEDIQKEFSLPTDYLTSALDNRELPRSQGLDQETFKEPILLLFQYPHATISPTGFSQYEAYPFNIILLPDKLITVCNHEEQFIEIKQRKEEANSTKAAVIGTATQLIWNIAQAFNDSIQTLSENTERLESQLKVAIENNQLYQVMDIKKSLIYLQYALSENLNVLDEVNKTNWISRTPHVASYLQDVMIETKQTWTSAKIQLQLVSQMSDLFSAIVSNNLNIIMKVLTSITIVLTIPTIIGGLYGMNTTLPFAHIPYAFWWICLVTAGLCLLTIWLLKKKKFF